MSTQGWIQGGGGGGGGGEYNFAFLFCMYFPKHRSEDIETLQTSLLFIAIS